MKKFKGLLFWTWICLMIQVPATQALQPEENISLIPAGTFFMGTEEGTEIERPIYKVYLKKYKISRFEVSNLEFEKFRPGHKRRRVLGLHSLLGFFTVSQG